uniref:PI3K/PI4K catalytic domain-containing protein n=1 Tax=Mola mola TaxID=94237 RepID=A0A3Q3WFN7_MOLML
MGVTLLPPWFDVALIRHSALQALKSEWELDGPLTALRHCCGRALRQELERETRLMSVLVQVAEKIRAADKSRRKNVLKKEKSEIEEFFKDGISCCLPLDLAVRVKGLDLVSSVLLSQKTNFQIVFMTSIKCVLQTGDNLRQDMLVLQIVRMMDRVWLEEGLDLRMITYRCLSTSRAQGQFILVPEAVTLGKIPQEWGLAGSLREDTLEKWFHMWNKTKEDYEKVNTDCNVFDISALTLDS